MNEFITHILIDEILAHRSIIYIETSIRFEIRRKKRYSFEETPLDATYLTDIGYYEDSRSSILPTQSIQVGRCEENFLCQYMRPRMDGILKKGKAHSNSFWVCLNPPSCTATRDVSQFRR